MLAGGKHTGSSLFHKTKKLKNLTVGLIGPGNVFGDSDVISKRRYMYTLRCNRVGSTAYVLK